MYYGGVAIQRGLCISSSFVKLQYDLAVWVLCRFYAPGMEIRSSSEGLHPRAKNPEV